MYGFAASRMRFAGHAASDRVAEALQRIGVDARVRLVDEVQALGDEDPLGAPLGAVTRTLPANW